MILTPPPPALITERRAVSPTSSAWAHRRPIPALHSMEPQGLPRACLEPGPVLRLLGLSVHPQKSFYNLMTSDKKSERFFKVLHDRMKRAQQETKSTVAVNMSELGSQPREDREPADPAAKGLAQRVQGEGGQGAQG